MNILLLITRESFCVLNYRFQLCDSIYRSAVKGKFELEFYKNS